MTNQIQAIPDQNLPLNLHASAVCNEWMIRNYHYRNYIETNYFLLFSYPWLPQELWVPVVPQSSNEGSVVIPIHLEAF